MKKYRLTAPTDTQTISEYTEWLWPWCVFHDPLGCIFCGAIGEFELDGVCNHPDAVEVTA